MAKVGDTQHDIVLYDVVKAFAAMRQEEHAWGDRGHGGSAP
ncbi:hypothetical protein AB0K00_22430 [Dactylosporangium sp. NPDC049525]